MHYFDNDYPIVPISYFIRILIYTLWGRKRLLHCVANFWLKSSYPPQGYKNKEALNIFPLTTRSFIWQLYDIVVQFSKNCISNSKIKEFVYTGEEKITINENNEAIIIFLLIFPFFLWLLYDFRFPKNFICNSKILNKCYLPEKKWAYFPITYHQLPDHFYSSYVN